MEVEIINKKMLVWNNSVFDCKERLVLAKVTGGDTSYPIKTLDEDGMVGDFKHCKPIFEEEEVNMTVAEVSKAIGKKVRIVG